MLAVAKMRVGTTQGVGHGEGNIAGQHSRSITGSEGFTMEDSRRTIVSRGGGGSPLPFQRISIRGVNWSVHDPVLSKCGLLPHDLRSAPNDRRSYVYDKR